jgi:hypothetical protein
LGRFGSRCETARNQRFDTSTATAAAAMAATRHRSQPRCVRSIVARVRMCCTRCAKSRCRQSCERFRTRGGVEDGSFFQSGSRSRMAVNVSVTRLAPEGRLSGEHLVRLEPWRATFQARCDLRSRRCARAITLYNWPRNVRELQNRVQRAVIMADGKRVKATDLDWPMFVAAHQRHKLVDGEARNREG